MGKKLAYLVVGLLLAVGGLAGGVAWGLHGLSPIAEHTPTVVVTAPSCC